MARALHARLAPRAIGCGSAAATWWLPRLLACPRRLSPPALPPASYLTAAFAKLVSREGAPGKAIGVEHIPELTRWAACFPSTTRDCQLAEPLWSQH